MTAPTATELLNDIKFLIKDVKKTSLIQKTAKIERIADMQVVLLELIVSKIENEN